MKLNKLAIALLATSIGFITTQAHAATSADLTITGTVDEDCSVSLDTSSKTIDIQSGEVDSTMANVTEICNDADGFSISFSSANSGVLQNDDNAGEQKSYTISYGSGASSFDSQSLTQSRSVSYNTFTAGHTVPLRLNLASHSGGVLAAGTWSDVITVSIAAQ